MHLSKDSHAFFCRALLGVWTWILLGFSIALNPALAQSIEVSTYIRVSRDQKTADLCFEAVSPLHYRDLTLVYTLDGWAHKKEMPLTNKLSQVWRGCINHLRDEAQAEFTLRAKNLVTNTTDWMSEFGNNQTIQIHTQAEAVRYSRQGLRTPDFTPTCLDRCSLPIQGGTFVSITTSPDRIHRLPDRLNEINMEEVDRLFVSIPTRFSRTGKPYTIPKELRVHPKVSILQTKDDAGPIMKLLPALEFIQARTKGALLITLDDDIQYPRDIITELKRLHKVIPKAILGASGQNIQYWGIPRFGFPRTLTITDGSVPELKSVDVVEGFAGVAYPVDAMPVEQLKNFSQLSQDAYTSDDFVVALTSALENIPRFRVATPLYHAGLIRELDYGMGSDALHKLGAAPTENSNAARYYRAYKAMIESGNLIDFETLDWIPQIQTRFCSDIFSWSNKP